MSIEVCQRRSSGAGPQRRRVGPVRELLRTNDPVEISWLVAVLESEDIRAIVLDGHMSVTEGSISAITRRIMVEDRDYFLAQRAHERARAELGRPSSPE
jgi:hypothetical protein